MFAWKKWDFYISSNILVCFMFCFLYLGQTWDPTFYSSSHYGISCNSTSYVFLIKKWSYILRNLIFFHFWKKYFFKTTINSQKRKKNIKKNIYNVASILLNSRGGLILLRKSKLNKIEAIDPLNLGKLLWIRIGFRKPKINKIEAKKIEARLYMKIK